MKKLPVLMTAENPDGWTLEGLLAQLVEEVEAKTGKIASDTSRLASDVRFNNFVIINNLTNALSAQRRSIRLLAEAGPDEGPLGKPRIGPGRADSADEGSDYV